jgi:hypothetical protein
VPVAKIGSDIDEVLLNIDYQTEFASLAPPPIPRYLTFLTWQRQKCQKAARLHHA